MTDQTRADQSAEIAHRADERAMNAQRTADRVEHALTDRINDLADKVSDGFERVFEKLDAMADEIVALKVENAKRTGVERFLKWALTIMATLALGLLGIFYTGGAHHPPTQQ
jgi:hypothetical protein